MTTGTLPPDDEALYMKSAVILAVLNEELRKGEEEQVRNSAPGRAA